LASSVLPVISPAWRCRETGRQHQQQQQDRKYE
jgi:hypothetical protein